MYDTKTVETITGEVVAVNRVPSGKDRAGGVHLMLKTDAEEIAVHEHRKTPPERLRDVADGAGGQGHDIPQRDHHDIAVAFEGARLAGL